MGSVTLARTLVRHAERAMVRSADAVLIRGNRARILPDSADALEAWIEAISHAQDWIHLENYIIRDDRTGRRFRELLADKARSGVRVRVLYDWLGCWATPNSFWRPMRAAGIEVRSFSPPRVTEPLRILRRDHRKVVAVDGRYASVGGMCIGDEWAGDAAAGVPAWRDTGVEIQGPAAAVVDRAFARSWREAGPMLPLEEIPDPHLIPAEGDVSIRVVEGEPGKSRIYRLSQFVSVGVEKRLWITDPYFVTPPAMTEAFAAAARDGVDVRILVPAYNNWPIIGGFSRAGYRSLLEAGVRIFEWEGPMIHAKTAVADGVWTRIGSSNLNLASLMSNWELDLAILDLSVGRMMEDLFIQDLGSAVEVQLPPPRAERGRRTLVREPVHEAPVNTPRASVHAAREARRRARRGSPFSRVLGRVSRASIVLSRSLLGQRNVALEDRGWMAAIALILLCVAAVGFFFPRFVAWPVAFAMFWIGIASIYRVFNRSRSGE